jgi:hypothetical protein
LLEVTFTEIDWTNIGQQACICEVLEAASAQETTLDAGKDDRGIDIPLTTPLPVILSDFIPRPNLE